MPNPPLCYYCSTPESEHLINKAKHEAHDCYDEECEDWCNRFRANFGDITTQEIRAEQAEAALAATTAAHVTASASLRTISSQLETAERRVAMLERVLDLVEAIVNKPAREQDRWASPPISRRWSA